MSPNDCLSFWFNQLSSKGREATDNAQDLRMISVREPERKESY
jgi:hypothetical protein